MARSVAYGVIGLLSIAVAVRGWGIQDELRGLLPRFESAPDALPPGEGRDSIDAVVVDAGPTWIKARPEGQAEAVRYPVAGEPLCVDPPPGVRIHSYHLSDVRPGDKVILQLIWRAGEPWCERIMIRRRPGGRVPPIRIQINITPDFPEGTWAHRMNAEQDWEERGIPLPPQYEPPPPGPPPVILVEVTNPGATPAAVPQRP